MCVRGRKLQPVVIIRTSQCEMQCFFLILEYIYVSVWVSVGREIGKSVKSIVMQSNVKSERCHLSSHTEPHTYS